MVNEKSKRSTVKDESSDEPAKCGRTRSSEEIAVMAMERRDSVIYTLEVKQPAMGGFYERRKVVSYFQTSNT